MSVRSTTVPQGHPFPTLSWYLVRAAGSSLYTLDCILYSALRIDLKMGPCNDMADQIEPLHHSYERLGR
jgi:hypothetical protein